MGNLVGQQLGNYRLIRLLGQGGFADAYLGEHIHLNTTAAIKVLQTRSTCEIALQSGTRLSTVYRLSASLAVLEKYSSIRYT